MKINDNHYQLLIVKKITKIHENEGTKNVPMLENVEIKPFSFVKKLTDTVNENDYQ